MVGVDNYDIISTSIVKFKR